MLRLTSSLVLFAAIFGTQGVPVVPSNMINLGSINGKFFFYDSSSELSWSDAKTLCKDSGMVLAEISTVEEEDFLKSKYSVNQFHGAFWTGARDAQSPQQFIWETTKNQMSNSLRWYSFGNPRTCAFYLAASDESFNGYLSSYDCTAARYTLCQAA